MTFDEPEAQENEEPQGRRLAFGGELKSLASLELGDVPRIDLVGVLPDSASAERALPAKVQQTVDSAQTRRFVAHPLRPIEPDPAPLTRIA